MAWIPLLVILFLIALLFWRKRRRLDLSVLPERFIVFDLETTGLKPERHEIIEIGAIRVNRDSENHDTFQALVKPKKKVPNKIEEITGISQQLVEKEGGSLEEALNEFLDFVGDLPLVAFNAEFDMAFLKRAIAETGASKKVNGRVSCALKMSRRAWPGRKSYKLKDLAKDGGLSNSGLHRALEDCKRTMIVYTAAAAKLKSAS